MNKTLSLFVVGLLGLATAAASAGTIVCSGTIDVLQFDATNTGGLLSIKLSSMNVPVSFCDPDNSFSGTGSGLLYFGCDLSRALCDFSIREG